MKTLSEQDIVELRPLLDQIDRLKAQKDALPELSTDVVGRIMQKFRLDWNFHSNSLEGNLLTYGETVAFLMEGLTAKGKPFKDHLDIKGHDEAINYLLELIKNGDTITEKDVRELHRILLQEPYYSRAITPTGQETRKQIQLGTYKSQPNHVRTPTGEMHYYATPEETPARMEALMTWYRKSHQAGVPTLLRAAILHYNFVAIHPFDDGNGRMGRLLMNLVFLQDGFPPVVIRAANRDDYLSCLHQADAGDLRPFVAFVGQNLLHALELFLKGARGEPIEEPSDLDKEIALLTAALRPKRHDGPSKDSRTFIETYRNSLAPLFERVRIEARKLSPLFDHIHFHLGCQLNQTVDYTTVEGRPFAYYADLWQSDANRMAQLDAIELLSLDVKWAMFKNPPERFTIERVLPVSFFDTFYTINFGLENQEQVTKSYGATLTGEEKTAVAERFIREVLAEIKRKTAPG